MKVIYTGPMALGYHSAPSQFDYIFDPGVAQAVKEEDEQFFRSLAASPGTSWQCVGLLDDVVKVAEDTLETLKKAGRKHTKRGDK